MTNYIQHNPEHHTTVNHRISFGQRISRSKFLIISLLVGSVSLAASSIADEKLGAMVSNAYFLTIPSLLVVISVILAKTYNITATNKRVLWLFVGAAVLNMTAEVTRIVYENVLQVEPWPSEADYLWFGGYLFLGAFLLMYLKPIRKSIPQSIKIFSAVIIAGFFCPILLLGYLLHADLDTSELVLSLAYPILDGLILFVLLTALISMYKRKNKEFLTLMLFAMISFSTSDIIFLLESENYSGGDLLDIGYFNGYLLLIFGILRFRQVEKKDAYTNYVYVDDNNKIVNTVDFEPTTKLLVPITIITVSLAVFAVMMIDSYMEYAGKQAMHMEKYLVAGSVAVFSIIMLLINKTMIALVKKRTSELESERDMLGQKIAENAELLREKTQYAESCKMLSTDIAHTLELVAANELKFRNLYENALAMHRTVNKDGIILDCNTLYLKQLGYSKSEVIGKSIFEHVAEQDVNLLKASFAAWKEKGITKNQELRLKRKDGTVLPILLSANNLYDQNGQLVGSNTIMQDITVIYETRKQLQKNEEMLKASMERMHKLARAKDEFVAMITHELKTPLTPIISYADLLLSERLGPCTDEQKKRLDIIKTSAHSLQKTISDLLDVQKIEMGHLKLDKGLYNVVDIINDVIVKMESAAVKSGIRLGMNCQSEKIHCMCDQARIEQVLMNLISNAIDFCPKEKGRIQVKAYASDGFAKIIVVDNGIGIVKEKLDKIFVKFYQIDSKMTREHGGTGLGLAVCKGIIDGHGGKIWAESNGPGSGTEIHIALPLADDQPNLSNA